MGEERLAVQEVGLVGLQAEAAGPLLLGFLVSMEWELAPAVSLGVSLGMSLGMSLGVSLGLSLVDFPE